MTENRETVDRYMDGFRRGDHAAILSCLTEDVEWRIPGAFHARGRAAFDAHIEDEAFVRRPEITVERVTEASDVLVAEGAVRTQRRDGPILRLAFCDVFELERGRIRRLTSYLMPIE